jgi:pullulanase-type alpha-1,6-glucosidase
VYGEAWNFGEVVNDARFVQARQANMAGTGIGSFNDRIRDAVRGGGPFDNLERQGFASGLYYDSNGKGHDGSLEQERQELLRRTDWLRVSLAGNLADYTFVDRTGATVSGRDVMYHDQRAGYTADPQEVVNYVEAHDNETLYDAFAAKLPLATSMEQRVRAQVLALSTVLLAQGVPFLHAGGELLRSKSMDRNSYNSGDWFNRLDFSMSTNNWGVGLPPARDNQAAWSTIQPLLANPALRPTASDIAFAHARFLELLGIRTSSPLFRLRTGAEVQARLGFRNTGPGQVPGVVVMELSDAPSPDLDPNAEAILVVFNATDEQQLLSYPDLRGRQFKLHHLQRTSTDEVVTESQFVPGQGRVRVPARTTAVFVEG